MIVICEECGKKYRIDPDKIKGSQANFDCKACNHRITVTKPEPEKAIPPEAQPSPPPVTEPAGREKAAPEPPQKPAPPTPTPPPGSLSRKNRFGLTEKMISLMLVVTLFPLLLFWGLTFEQTNTRIRQDSEKLILQRSERLAAHVDEWIDKNIRILNVAANLPVMAAMAGPAQQPVLESIAANCPWIEVVLALDTAGLSVARSDAGPAVTHADHRFFKEVIAGKETAWETLVDPSSKQQALVLAVPVRSGDEIRGVLASVMNIGSISGQLVGQTPDPTGTAFLVDTAGTVIAHQRLAMASGRNNLGTHPLIAAHRSGGNELISFPGDDGTPALGHARRTAFGWVAAVQAEEKEIFQILKKAQFFAYIYLGVIMVLVVAVAFLAGRRMTRPIKELTDAADRISVGELDVEIRIRRKDEIGDLADAIIRMQDSLRLSIQRLRRRR